MPSSTNDSVTVGSITTGKLLPVAPLPDWSSARFIWQGYWPAHVYGFAVAFLVVAILSLPLSANCYWFVTPLSKQNFVGIMAINAIIGVNCLAKSCILLIDAYQSIGLLPVAVVQLVHGLGFPSIVATLTLLDRVLSALVRRRPRPGSIKHARIITVSLSIYFSAVSASYVVIAMKPEARLWLLLAQTVTLAWSLAVLFLVICQCMRLSSYARATAKSRRQMTLYIRTKRQVEKRLGNAEEAETAQRRTQLVRHLARLRVPRTKSEEFRQQLQLKHQQQIQGDEIVSPFNDVISSTSSSSSDEYDGDLMLSDCTLTTIASEFPNSSTNVLHKPRRHRSNVGYLSKRSYRYRRTARPGRNGHSALIPLLCVHG